MTTQLSPVELLEIEKQLSHPKGAAGLRIAENMDRNNRSMTHAAIEALHLQDGEKIMEIGHGNAGHLVEVLRTASKLTYYGLEVSETMKAEAARINAKWASEYQFQFDLYDGKTIPLPANSLDKICTVNTIYFWDDPDAFLQELYRVLKPYGKLAIAFAHEDFMAQLPFVQQRFRLYSTDEVKTRLKHANLPWLRDPVFEELVESKSGELVRRKYSVIIASKN